jgi:uncharacterized protein YqhQ
MPSYTYGGQALIEGVLMRGRDAIAVALRHPDGRIVIATERLDSGFHGSRWSRLPFLRGLVVLYETLVVGTRWLVRSAGVAASEEGVELGRGAIVLTLSITLAVAIGIFFVLPLVLASLAAGGQSAADGHTIVQSLIEGLIRVALFIGYLMLISLAPDVRRVFQYHGAEHMSIHALEAGNPLAVAAVRRYPTAHQRCGTEFLVIVVALSIIAFALVGKQDPLVMVGSRVLLIPVIAAVGYELLRWGARHRSNPIVHALFLPGIWVQMITTRRPTDEMIEVAIVALEEALVADGATVPDGSAELPREPLDRIAPASLDKAGPGRDELAQARPSTEPAPTHGPGPTINP